MSAPAASETFGLPPEASHLIAKLRNMPPEQLNQILNHENMLGGHDDLV